MTAALAIVSSNPTPEKAGEETLSDRIRRLQDEARSMAREHVSVLEAAMLGLVRTASEIADGGDAYPVGAREMARQLISDTEARMLSLEAIMSRRH